MHPNYFTVANRSHERNCTIISTSLTNLTTDGGEVIDGARNVIIYCVCMMNNITTGGARWFFPNGTRIRIQSPQKPGSPYYINNIPTPLIFPSFVYPYAGTYGCGFTKYFKTVALHGDTIDLTLSGMNIIIYFSA